MGWALRSRIAKRIATAFSIIVAAGTVCVVSSSRRRDRFQDQIRSEQRQSLQAPYNRWNKTWHHVGVCVSVNCARLVRVISMNDDATLFGGVAKRVIVYF
jgi:hypothetical protein